MRIAVFGGTFNPVHLGHLGFCCQCVELYGFDQALLVPVNLPPHKPAGELASNSDRLEMLQLAVKEYPFLIPCDIEFRLGGTSYTVNTLAALCKEIPEAEFTLLIGSDMLRTFRQWYRWEEILEMSSIVVGARREEEYRALVQCRDTFGVWASRISIAAIQAREISSTQIREAIRRGGDARIWLPPAVWDYICEHGLYQREGF